MAYLKLTGFLGMCVFTLALMIWYMHKNKNVVYKDEHTDPMYFYKQKPVYKQNFHFTLREEVKCEINETFLVILVTSRPTDMKSRQAIRQSWGSQNSWWGNRVLILFLLGQTDKTSSFSIKDESSLYRDIIQQDFLDTYYNLTLKTIMAFRWVTEFCSRARFVMKTDTDVFINTGNLVKYLLNYETAENFITGYPLIEARCFREASSKAYVTYEEYPFEIFPPYMSGLGYVLHGRLAHRIYLMMAHVKPVKFEDVYIGICLSLLKVGITFPKDEGLFFFTKTSFDICKFKHLIAAHSVTPEEMILFWDEITKESPLPSH